MDLVHVLDFVMLLDEVMEDVHECLMVAAKGDYQPFVLDDDLLQMQQIQEVLDTVADKEFDVVDKRLVAADHDKVVDPFVDCK